MSQSEPEWKQPEHLMIATLEKMTRGRDDDWSACNWALWQMEKLRARLNDLGEYADELEAKLDDRQD